jgi:type II secretory pathway pseudopilin PulG/nucleoid DNA-binding protein
VKFDDLLAQYLYEHKTLQLQGIGTFTLEGKVSIPYEQEKEIYYPIEGLNFKYNSKETTQEHLVMFLVNKLGKIQPLVRSDLESYLSNVKQFINLGKPYTIEGVGTLHLNNQGNYEFTPGNFLPVKEELNPRRENPEHNYPQKTSSNAGKILLVVLVVVASLAALGGIGWGIYSFVANKQEEKAEALPVVADSTDTEVALTDTTHKTDSSQVVNNPSPATSTISDTARARYKMIFELTPSKQRAISRTSQLQTLKINAAYDSTGGGNTRQYRIYVIKRLQAADTIRVRDSIAKFFLRKVTIDRE